jgi:hypothetical protein
VTNLIPAAAIAEANGETANFSAFGAATTLSRSTAFPGVGAVSLLSTYTGTGYPYIYPINPTLWGAPVTAGSAYSACITAQLGSGTTGLQGGSPQISWYDINGNYLSNTAGSYTALSASVATQLTVVNATAPTSAAFAIVQLNGGQSVAVGDSVAIGKLGIFAGTTVPTWTPPPVTTTTGWLTKSGTSLQLAGAAWRAAGADLYYLGLDDNIRDGSNSPTYPTHYRIDNVMATAEAMGFTVVRAHTLGISTGQGQAYTFMTGLNTYNPAALESIDYAIASAARHGIRLVIPLTDQYRYYHGGKWNFVHNRAGTNGVTDVDMTTTGSTTPPTYSLNVNNGTEKANEAQFYTNTTIISDFEGYIARLLNHVNVYTGISLGADPTCAIWETGNEIYDATAAWTDTIAAYIKTQAPNALVSDGSAATGLAVSSAPGLSSSHVDIVGSHYYPPNTAQLTTDLAAAAGASKVFAIGEYDWTGANGGPTLAAWEAQMAGSAVAYDAFWTLLPYEENGTAEPHTDGYQFWNPAPSATGGSITQAAMTTAASAMTTHAAAMSAGTGGTVVQTTVYGYDNVPNETLITPSFTATPIAGDTLILVMDSQITFVGSVSGCGATWARLASDYTNNTSCDGMDVWIGTGATGASKVVMVTAANSTTFAEGGATLIELAGAWALKVSPQYSNVTAATEVTTAGIIPAVGDLIVSVASGSSGVTKGSPSPPWTEITGPTSGTSAYMPVAYQQATSTGNSYVTWNQSSSGNFNALIFSLVVQAPISGLSFPIADPTEVDAVNSGSLAVRLIAIDSFFGTPAVPTVPTCIQYVNGTQNQPTVVLPNVTQAGNCLVACVVDTSNNEIGDTAPPSGTGWQMVGGDMNNPGYGATQYLVWPNHPGGIQSQTWNLGLNGGTQSSVTIAEFSGMPPALAVDQYVEGPPTSNNYTYTFAGTTAPIAPYELILSGVNSGPAVTKATTSATPNSLGNDSDNNFFAWGRTGTAAISQTVNVNGSPSHSGFIVLRAAIESVTP